MQRSFVSLTPQEALQVAISIEDRNAELYHRFAEMFTEFGDDESLDIAGVFWEMAIEERGHSSLLRQKYADRYGDSPCHISEQDLVEMVEVPRLQSGDLFAFPTSGVPARVRALKVALQAESGAQRFYAKLAEQTPIGALHDLFDNLAEMEDGHASYLENKLAQDSPEEAKVN
jgi:rubrerythrin